MAHQCGNVLKDQKMKSTGTITNFFSALSRRELNLPEAGCRKVSGRKCRPAKGISVIAANYPDSR